MTKSNMQRNVSITWRIWEDHRRQELEAGFTPAVSPKAEKLLDQLRHSLEDLRARYLEKRNPVDVWEAIQQIEIIARLSGEEISLPHWILAYLLKAAAGIAGMAASWPLEPMNRDDKVGDAYFTDQSRRPDFVLEVLGFKTTKGQNLLASEQKRRDSEIMRAKHGRLQRQGLTKQQAADQINDPSLNAVADKRRKLRRIERKSEK